METKGNQDMRLTCIDIATRVVGKPVYLADKDDKFSKYHDDIVKVAKEIYEFVTKE